MTEIEITPDTTVTEHAAAMAERLYGEHEYRPNDLCVCGRWDSEAQPDFAGHVAEEAFASLADENLNLRRRIQETMEVCASSFINLDAFDSDEVSGLAVLIEDVKDALTDDEGPVITKVFFSAFLEQLEVNRGLHEDFKLRLGDVTRITVVDTSYGRAHESWKYHGVELHLQDDGRTLKVFPKRKPDLESNQE